MGSINARKFFSRRVTIPSNQALSLYALMQLAPATASDAVWGFNADGTFPSLDSSWGDGATIIPASQTVYVGRSADVTAANGVPCNATVPYNLVDYCGAIVDTEQVFIYSTNAQGIDIVFQGRQ